MISPQTIGKRLREAREKRSLRISVVSKRSTISRQTIYRVEAGVHRPQGYTLTHLCAAIGCSEADILRSEEQ